MTKNIVLCGANSYLQKYYLNEDFINLPEKIKKEIQIICVTFTEEIGGILFLEFNENGNLKITVQAEDSDYLFDEIGSELKVKDIRIKNKELFENLETYFKTIYLNNL